MPHQLAPTPPCHATPRQASPHTPPPPSTTQPGTELLEEMGGLHGFMAWPHNLLTDSGGFQMVSLLALARVCG